MRRPCTQIFDTVILCIYVCRYLYKMACWCSVLLAPHTSGSTRVEFARYVIMGLRQGSKEKINQHASVYWSYQIAHRYVMCE